MEILFTLIRQNKNINGINILGFEFKLTAYADDSSFFVKDLNSVKEICNTLGVFVKYSGLKINRSKNEIAGIGAMNGVQVAL